MVGSTGEVHNEMSRYKDQGQPNHIAVMSLIPKTERIPALTKIYGTDKIAAVLSKAITKALNKFNLRVGMNADQVAELSYALIDDAESDHLAIQDIMLFLDGFAMFKYGKVYDRMDMPTFFEMLEVYREKRHQEFVRHKDEQDSQYKAYGDSNRMSNDVDKDQMRDAMKIYMQKNNKNK